MSKLKLISRTLKLHISFELAISHLRVYCKGILKTRIQRYMYKMYENVHYDIEYNGEKQII